MEESWYHRWFGADYLQLYRHRSPEEAESTIQWLLDELKIAPPARVLDLACGAGRHSKILHRKGFVAFGLDLSWDLLRVSSDDAGTEFYSVRGDMRSLPFKSGQFNLVLSLFTSFGYFKTEENNQRVLDDAGRLLARDGYYVLDFLNARRVIDEIIPEEETTLGQKRVKVKRWIDTVNQRVEKLIQIEEQPGSMKEYRESIRLYDIHELSTMLVAAGFNNISSFGDYRGSVYREDSPRLILIGRNNA